ncbi:MAG TPA: ABC transporter permease, partial [Actinomycetota bacterium]
MSQAEAVVDPSTAYGVEAAVVGKTPWELFWGRFKQDRMAFIGLGFIGVLVLIAVFAPVIANLVGHGPNDLFQRRMTDAFGLPRGPNSEFFFGADKAGRDLFVRVMYGARTSLTVALVSTAASVAIGVTLGILAGYFGGKIDTLISRGIDIVLSMPLLLFAIGIVAACST